MYRHVGRPPFDLLAFFPLRAVSEDEGLMKIISSFGSHCRRELGMLPEGGRKKSITQPAVYVPIYDVQTKAFDSHYYYYYYYYFCLE
jgi:hypothetical protein